MPLDPINIPRQPCFVCGEPTRRRSSLTKPQSPPLDKADSTPICHNCILNWNFAIAVVNSMNPKTP